MAQPIRVLIADDSARARDGLRALLTTWSEVMVVGEAVNGHEAVQISLRVGQMWVLMDVQMPVLDGIQATRLVKQHWPTVIVVMLTMYASEQIAAIAAGADAFVVKGSGPERLLAAMGVVDISSKL